MEEKKENSNTVPPTDKKSIEILENYLSDRQAGQYQVNSQFLTDQLLVHAGTTANNEHVIMVFGKYFPLPNNKKEITKLKRYFIFVLDELVESKYIMMYFHSGLSSYSYIQTMYYLIRKLPNKYYANLQKFYIVDQSFLVKSYNFFNLPTALKTKLEYLKSLRMSIDLPWYKKEFEEKVHAYVKAVGKSEGKPPSEAAIVVKQQLFGLNLDELDLGEVQIPRIIEEFINYFRNHESHIKEQGIFRKAPRDSDIKELEAQLIMKNYAFIQSHDDPHVIATSFKRLLSTMPEPIFPFKSYDMIKLLPQLRDTDERREKIKTIVESIPEMNFRVLRHIIDLLRQVQSYSDDNLMKTEALTKIFAPTLIRGRPQAEKMQEAVEELMMNPTIVEMMSIIYNDYETIFASILFDGNPNPDFMEALMLDDLQEYSGSATEIVIASSTQVSSAAKTQQKQQQEQSITAESNTNQQEKEQKRKNDHDAAYDYDDDDLDNQFAMSRQKSNTIQLNR